MYKKITIFKLVTWFFISQILIYIFLYILKLENQGNENFFKKDFILVMIIYVLASILINKVVYNFEKKVLISSYYFLFINNVYMLSYLEHSESKYILNIETFISFFLLSLSLAAFFEVTNSTIKNSAEFNFIIVVLIFFRSILGLMVIFFFLIMIKDYFEIIHQLIIKEEFINTFPMIITFLMYAIIVSISIVFLIYSIYIYLEKIFSGREDKIEFRMNEFYLKNFVGNIDKMYWLDGFGNFDLNTEISIINIKFPENNISIDHITNGMKFNKIVETKKNEEKQTNKIDLIFTKDRGKYINIKYQNSEKKWKTRYAKYKIIFTEDKEQIKEIVCVSNRMALKKSGRYKASTKIKFTEEYKVKLALKLFKNHIFHNLKNDDIKNQISNNFSNFIANEKDKYFYAVKGNHGTGKTRFLKSEIIANGCIPIEISMWNEGNTDDHLASFVRELCLYQNKEEKMIWIFKDPLIYFLFFTSIAAFLTVFINLFDKFSINIINFINFIINYIMEEKYDFFSIEKGKIFFIIFLVITVAIYLFLAYFQYDIFLSKVYHSKFNKKMFLQYLSNKNSKYIFLIEDIDRILDEKRINNLFRDLDNMSRHNKTKKFIGIITYSDCENMHKKNRKKSKRLLSSKYLDYSRVKHQQNKKWNKISPYDLKRVCISGEANEFVNDIDDYKKEIEFFVDEIKKKYILDKDVTDEYKKCIENLAKKNNYRDLNSWKSDYIRIVMGLIKK